MGSEHYCLRWNNHQSNLLGVFSQLLNDESLVDVTLACAEGKSIRAHKVVLSACSSYFQSLFVDHPSRHPIVILKDVRFAELRTLVDFMYKGEVNVEYCQLPALLETAESLKVKGLAEMTTLSAAGIGKPSATDRMDDCSPQDMREPGDRNKIREPRELREPQDLREPREYREPRDLRDPREMRESRETRDPREARELKETRELREARDLREPRDLRDIREPHDLSEPRDLRNSRDRRNSREKRESREKDTSEASPPRSSPLLAVRRLRQDLLSEREALTSTHPPPPKEEPQDEIMRCSSPEEDDRSIRSNGTQSETIGLNMTINSNNSSSTATRTTFSPTVEQRLGVLVHAHTQLPHPHPPQLPSPRGEPIAGPSGLPPVQNAPLSLKKEIDWDKSNEEKISETTTDYRMPHETMCGEGGCATATPPPGLALWPPLLALHACRLRRYLSDDCLGYERAPPPPERRRCGVCLAAFPSAWLLERHAALQHAALPAPAPSPAPEDKPFVCEQCGQSYRYRSAYVKHREQNHRARLPADKLFTCDVCGMQFRYLKSFKKHRLNHTLERLHVKSADSQADAGDQVTSTDEILVGRCGEIDLSVRRRRVDDESAEDEQDGTVDSNGPADVDVDDAAECKSSGEDGRRSCDSGARAPPGRPGPGSLADSSESGAGSGSLPPPPAAPPGDDRRDRERRFACPFCGKCVRSKENLKLHVRKHTGERPFVCLFCGRAFGGKSDLTRHLRIHTGERPYHCEACGKCFARADYLSKHLTTHVHNSR